MSATYGKITHSCGKNGCQLTRAPVVSENLKQSIAFNLEDVPKIKSIESH